MARLYVVGGDFQLGNPPDFREIPEKHVGLDRFGICRKNVGADFGGSGNGNFSVLKGECRDAGNRAGMGSRRNRFRNVGRRQGVFGNRDGTDVRFGRRSCQYDFEVGGSAGKNQAANENFRPWREMELACGRPVGRRNGDDDERFALPYRDERSVAGRIVFSKIENAGFYGFHII